MNIGPWMGWNVYAVNGIATSGCRQRAGSELGPRRRKQEFG
jgi:hypothetical protein